MAEQCASRLKGSELLSSLLTEPGSSEHLAYASESCWKETCNDQVLVLHIQERCDPRTGELGDKASLKEVSILSSPELR